MFGIVLVAIPQKVPGKKAFHGCGPSQDAVEGPQWLGVFVAKLGGVLGL
ncbi:hypothetical protein Pla52o_50720 [Novipirellula galeiformis]|uniref:Uncharacterized protein n=1 Tax=Novipirellula galeiformis TaxID=2528004 RepID=A0A5C6C1X0_9BACT|nr:hypothetical protein Pla52o_50720 [Novipirellula galeiformis]